MIYRNYLEFDVVAHCNLRCAGCGHNSEMAAPSYYDLKTFQGEITRLSEVLHVDEFRLLGGEPLLHKQLPDFVRIAKASGIANVVSICTNAALVTNFGSELYSIIDKVDVTTYPNTNINYQEKLSYLNAMSSIWGFNLNVGHVDRFMQVFSPVERTEQQTKQVFDACKITHEWGCHTFKDGFYYKCPAINADSVDGVNIFEDELEVRLKKYLADSTPLNICRKCFGTSGETFKHFQISPRIKRNKKERKVA